MRSWGPCLLASLIASPALAQATFRDDFDSSTLLMPTGQWDNLVNVDPADTLAVMADAGLSGAGGITVRNALSGGSCDIGLERFISGTGDQYTRIWFRPVAVAAAAGRDNILIISRSNNFYTACQVYWNAVDRNWRLAAFDQSNTSTLRDTDAGSAAVGSWWLVELAALGMGTSAGRCRMWVNGAPVDQISGINWSSVTYRDISILPVNANPGNATVYGFDAFAASPQPMPSKLVWTIPPMLTVGQCSMLTVGLQTSDGAAANAPALTPLALGNLAPGTFWNNASCTVPVFAAFVGAGAPSTTVWFTPSQPIANSWLLATNPDYVAGFGAVTVIGADAGVPDAGSADGGASTDGGADGGGSADGGATDDGGTSGDGGTSSDGGATGDGGTTEDGGRVGDAGTMTDDAGTPIGSRLYAVGCGCTSGADTLGFALLLGLLACTRRTRASNRAP